jgi:succinate dehydrogenase hydrophobic anchor subunit
MIPAHMLFMHLNPSVAHEASVVLARMDNYFIKLMDLALVISVFYHGGYGLVALCRDYFSLSPRALRDGCTGVIVAVMALFTWIGVKLIFVI